MPDGVVDQVVQGLTEPDRVGVHACLARDVHDDRALEPGCQPTPAGTAEGAGERDVPRMEIERVAVHPGGGAEIRGQPAEPVGAAPDAVEEVVPIDLGHALPVRVERARGAIDDGRRCAQLVGGDGQQMDALLEEPAALVLVLSLVGQVAGDLGEPEVPAVVVVDGVAVKPSGA